MDYSLLIVWVRLLNNIYKHLTVSLLKVARLNKYKRMSPHSHEQYSYLPVADIGGHSFMVNYFLPININCEVYWVYPVILAFLRARIKDNRNNHRFIDTGKYNHQRKRLNDKKDLSGLGDFYGL